MANVLAVLDDDLRTLAPHLGERVALADAVGPRGVVARDDEVLLAHTHGLAGERRVSPRLALRVEAVAVQCEDEALLRAAICVASPRLGLRLRKAAQNFQVAE